MTKSPFHYLKQVNHFLVWPATLLELFRESDAETEVEPKL